MSEAVNRLEPGVVLVHWHADEAEALAAPLREGGHPVRVVSGSWAGGLSWLRDDPPRAMVISLRRLPSHGREVAAALTSTRWGRRIPLVFLDTPEEKQSAFREQFPGAAFLGPEELSVWLNGWQLPPAA